MAGQLQNISQIDFSGGENLVTSPYDLTPKQCARMVNFLLDEHGSARVRDGTLIQDSISPNPARPIVQIFNFVTVAGNTTEVAILRGVNSANPNSLYNRATTPWTLIGTFGSFNQSPDAVQFTDIALFANSRYDRIYAYTATANFAAIVNPGAPPGCDDIAIHLGQVWAWGTNSTTVNNTGPSSLQASDVNSVYQWPAGSQTYINRDDGQEATGIGLYTIAEAGISPTATLIAFKNFSAYEVSGTFGASLSVQRIKSDMGCVARRSIQFISGFGIIRLTHRGFALYDGVNDTLISEEIRPRIFGRDDIAGLDWTYVPNSVAAQCANPPLYLCACPSGAQGLDIVFVFDLVRRSWTVLKFANTVSTLKLILTKDALPVVLGGDFSAGYVRRYFSGDDDDDGTAISWILRTRGFFMQSPLSRMFVQRSLVKIFDMATTNSLTMNYYYGPSSAVPIKSVTKMLPNPTQIAQFLGFGDAPFGSDPFGSPTTNTVVDGEMSFGAGFLCNNVTCELVGSGPGRIRGIDVHCRQKPLTVSTQLRS